MIYCLYFDKSIIVERKGVNVFFPVAVVIAVFRRPYCLPPVYRLWLIMTLNYDLRVRRCCVRCWQSSSETGVRINNMRWSVTTTEARPEGSYG